MAVDWDRGECFDDISRLPDDRPEPRRWVGHPDDYSGEDSWLDSHSDVDEWELNEVYADFAAGEYDGDF